MTCGVVMHHGQLITWLHAALKGIRTNVPYALHLLSIKVKLSLNVHRLMERQVLIAPVTLSHILERAGCMCCLNPFGHADGVSQAIDMLHTVRAASPAAIWTVGRAFSPARLEFAVTS